MRVSNVFRWVCSGIFLAKFREHVWAVIRNIVEHLEDFHSVVRLAAIEPLSKLAVQGMS